MKLFTELYTELDQTNKTNEKVEVLKNYFAQAEKSRCGVGFVFFIGQKTASDRAVEKIARMGVGACREFPNGCLTNRAIRSATARKRLRCFCRTITDVDETPLHILVEEQLLPLRGAGEEVQKREFWRRGRE